MKTKILRIALSVLISFSLWLYVVTVVTPEAEETYYDIPVSYQNDVLEERGLMIVSNTPTVTVKAKGNRTDLNELNANNITVLVDLASIQTPGTQMLQPKVIYPGNVAVETVSQNPNVLQLKVENRIKKPVPIRLEFQGSVPEGFIADKDNPVMDTTVVEVAGPQSSMDLIDHAIIQVDLSDKTESIVGAFQYVLCDEAGEPVDAEMITTNVEEVNLSVKIQAIKEVPLTVNLVEGGGATERTSEIKVDPEVIKVAGNETLLEDLEELNLGTIDLGELTKDSELTFTINLPNGVENLSGKTEAKVTVKFPELMTKTFTVTTFTAKNTPEGLDVEFITEELVVTVRGPKKLVGNMTANDLIVTVDFSNATEGNYTMKADVTMVSAYERVGAMGTYKISATLTASEEEDTKK